MLSEFLKIREYSRRMTLEMHLCRRGQWGEIYHHGQVRDKAVLCIEDRAADKDHGCQ